MSETTWKLVPGTATEEMVTRSGLYKWATYSQVAEGFESALSAAPKPAPGLYAVRDDGTARRVGVDVVGALQTAEMLLLHCDCHNGVTDATGTIDEGDVKAGEMVDTIRAVLRALTGEER